MILLGLLLILGIAVAWQEVRSDPEDIAIYGVEDSIEWVVARLSPEAREGMRRSDVRRILGHAVHYLQTPGVRSDPDAPPVVASAECARYVQDRSLLEGHAYDGPVILEVLDLQAEYLGAIGAVGDTVDPAAIDPNTAEPSSGDTGDEAD